jgi:nucleoside-diphosphate-sugar epimerase
MQVGYKPVLLLSSSKVYCGYQDKAVLNESISCIDDRFTEVATRSAAVYAIAAEHLFCLDSCLAIRPFNVYGPDITWGIVYNTIGASRRKENILYSPTVYPHFTTSFIHQDDFLKAIDKLLERKAKGVFNVGSPERASYVYLVQNVWKFVNGDLLLPTLLVSNTYCDGYPSLEKLEQQIEWLPKTSYRSGVFKML